MMVPTRLTFDVDFEVAPGDASDVPVANAHDWGSQCLVFGDGSLANTALRITQALFNKGIACTFSKTTLFQHPMTFSGGKFGHHNLLRHAAKSISTPFNIYDVLLRMLDYKPAV